MVNRSGGNKVDNVSSGGVAGSRVRCDPGVDLGCQGALGVDAFCGQAGAVVAVRLDHHIERAVTVCMVYHRAAAEGLAGLIAVRAVILEMDEPGDVDAVDVCRAWIDRCAREPCLGCWVDLARVLDGWYRTGTYR